MTSVRSCHGNDHFPTLNGLSGPRRSARFNAAFTDSARGRGGPAAPVDGVFDDALSPGDHEVTGTPCLPPSHTQPFVEKQRVLVRVRKSCQ